MHRPPLLRGWYAWYLFLLETAPTVKAVVWLEGLVNEKISVAPSSIEPATFLLVAQCLNQIRHREFSSTRTDKFM